jgi:hypothetical protein
MFSICEVAGAYLVKMKNQLASLAFLLWGCAATQPPPKPMPAPPPIPPVVLDRSMLPRGAVLQASVDQTLATDRSKVGERFLATLHTPIVDRNGKVLLPDKSKLVMSVDKIEKGRGARAAKLEIAPAAVQVACPGGTLERPITAHTVEVPLEAAPDEPDRDRARRGAIGGAIFGGMLLWVPGVAIGYGIGGGGGMAESLAERVVNAQLIAGTAIKVEVERPLWLKSLSCATRRYTAR